MGLRRVLLNDLEKHTPAQVSFMEVAPDNWIDVGGRWGGQFRKIGERTPILCHGLSLNLGGV
ncbi:MAG: multinuclear nonheme iron-dependent oxidase, partial [Gammaproteobacteria bacterium]